MANRNNEAMKMKRAAEVKNSKMRIKAEKQKAHLMQKRQVELQKLERLRQANRLKEQTKKQKLERFQNVARITKKRAEIVKKQKTKIA